MGTKRNPGTFDCYDAADPDEEMFVLLARDELAPILVDLWAVLRALRDGPDSPKAQEAAACAKRMRQQHRDVREQAASDKAEQWERQRRGPLCSCGHPQGAHINEDGSCAGWIEDPTGKSPMGVPGCPCPAYSGDG